MCLTHINAKRINAKAIDIIAVKKIIRPGDNSGSGSNQGGGGSNPFGGGGMPLSGNSSGGNRECGVIWG